MDTEGRKCMRYNEIIHFLPKLENQALPPKQKNIQTQSKDRRLMTSAETDDGVIKML